MDEETLYRQVVWNPHQVQDTDVLPESLQERLFDGPLPVLIDMTGNHNLSENTLKRMVAHQDPTVVEEVATNSILPEHLQMRLAADRNFHSPLGENPSLTFKVQGVVRQEALNWFDWIGCLGGNPNLRSDFKEEILQGEILHPLASNPNLTHPEQEVIYQRLKNSTERRHKNAAIDLIARPDLNLSILKDIIVRDEDLVNVVATSVKSSPENLRYLYEALEDQRGDLHGNPNLPTDLLDEAFKDPANIINLAGNKSLKSEQQWQIYQSHSTSVDILQSLAESTKDPYLQQALARTPETHYFLLTNPHTCSDVLNSMAPSLDHYDAYDLVEHPNYTSSLETPVRMLLQARSWLLEEAAREGGVDVKEVRSLSRNWQGSLGDIIEAVHLTRR